MKNSAFSLIEFLIGIVFLSIAILSLFALNSISQKQGMDAHYEFLALQLTQEPIEVLGALGYDGLANYNSNPMPEYPIGVETDVGLGLVNGIPLRPLEATQFRRQIDLAKIGDAQTPAIKISVTVFPKGEGRVKSWLSRKTITNQAIIIKQPI